MKYLVKFIVILLLISLCGCKNSLTNSDISSSSNSATVESDYVESNSLEIENYSSAYYETHIEVYEDIDEAKDIEITIQYPVIIGLRDVSLQDTINDLIKEAALRPYYNTVIYNGILDGTEWPVEYEITYASDDIISIKFEGYFYTQGFIHGNYEMYTVNINMNTGEKITTDALFDVSFQEKRKSRYFKGVDVDTTKSDSDAIDDVFSDYKEHFENRSNNFYFTKNHFIIILPLNGSYRFSSEYENLKDSMKSESVIWKCILVDD